MTRFPMTPLTMTTPLAVGQPALAFGWWVEIFTSAPLCIYYFGPFDSESEANFYRRGYVEDLKGEGARIVAVKLRLTQPRQLTIDEDELTLQDLENGPLAFFEALVIR